MPFPKFTAFLLLPAAIVCAQQQNGTITGKVLDHEGSPVNQAPVQATNKQSGTVYQGKSSPTGAYMFPQLPAGTYDLTIPVSGFERKTVTVEGFQTTTVDIRFIDEGITLNTLGEDLATRIADLNRPPPPSGPAPRGLDGKPDLSGVWWPPTTIDTGKPEMLPWAEALFKQRTESGIRDSPSARCLPDAVLRLGPFFKLVQTPTLLIVFMEEESPGYHQVFLDGRDHPKDLDPTWYGHSIGKWEGDTLVVDEVGFNHERWLTTRGQPITGSLHVTERYKRRDLGHLEIETTVDDPGTFAKPWTMKRVADLAPNQEIQEFVCENNKDPVHLVGK